jgi:hypothetical protein
VRGGGGVRGRTRLRTHAQHTRPPFFLGRSYACLGRPGVLVLYGFMLRARGWWATQWGFLRILSALAQYNVQGAFTGGAWGPGVSGVA